MPESPLKVLISGATGQISYSLLSSILSGVVFGQSQKISLHLLVTSIKNDTLKGLVMELQDCSFPLLYEIIATEDESVAFRNIDVAILVGAMPRREGMERKDLLAANVRIFKSQGMALDKYAKKTVKVLVVGNPANTNCLVASKYAPSISKKNFTCLTRLDHNRARAQVALKLNLTTDKVRRVTIWGNHSSTQFPDLTHAQVTFNDGRCENVLESIDDDDWMKNEFIPCVQKRGAAVIAARKLSSAMSAAKAICDHLRSWWNGTAENDWVSMGVMSDGSYGIDSDLVFSFPVRIDANKNWTIVKDLSVNDWARGMIEKTQKELVEERNDALETTK